MYLGRGGREACLLRLEIATPGDRIEICNKKL